jgi:nitroreductase
MMLVDDTVQIEYALCSTCTQCISICPEKALSWNHVPAVDYDDARLPSPEQLLELFRQRRSIRFFKRKPLGRALLEEIVNCSVYAPTNNRTLRTVVVDDGQLIEELERICVHHYSRVYDWLVKPRLVFRLLCRLTPALNPMIGQKLETRRHDRFYPAAIVFIVGDRRIALSEASAQCALDNMMLYAWTRGVGSCLWGAGRFVLDRSRQARDRLSLDKREHILGVLLLGYPAVTFRNTVRGRAPSIQWNGG